MKRAAKLIVVVAVVMVVAGLAIFEIYNTWGNREIFFENEPYLVFHNVAHVLRVNDFIVVTYKKDEFLVKERFQEDGKIPLILTFDKAEGDETYIELFRGMREPMLWLRDNPSDPPITLMKVHCGRALNGFYLCDLFKEDK